MYTKEVMDNFMNPSNLGEIENADGVGKVGNITCGDVMWLYLKIGKVIGGNAEDHSDEYIEDIKFKTLGCAAAISTSSMVTRLAKGKSVADALKITNKDVVDSLGGLPAPKIHCSLLAEEALREALYDFFEKKGRKIPEVLEKNHNKVSNTLCEIEHGHSHGHHEK